MAPRAKKPPRPLIIVGNWKMYKTIDEACEFIKTLAPLIEKSQAAVYLAVPFTAIQAAAEITPTITVGAQNMSDATEGAFTGEIAARMLKEVRAQFVILGHSERRHLFHESNAFINRKVHRALQEGIQPLLCVGETLEQRERNEVREVLKEQIFQSLEGVTKEQMGEVLLAYEPVWAIGTGKVATPEQAQETHALCREIVAEAWGKRVANKVVIQYGGSVKPDNAKALLSEPDIDGLLVGGASLTAPSFNEIIHAYQGDLT